MSDATRITPLNSYNAGADSEILSDGRVLFVFSPATNGFTTGFSVSIFDPVSKTVTSNFIHVSSASGYRTVSPDITVLATGNILLTWTDYAYVNGANSYVAHSELYNPAGASLSASFSVALPSNAIGKAVDTVALANGGYAIAYEAGNAADFDIRVQIFGADGQKLGAAFAVNAPNQEFPHTPVLTAFGTDDLAVAWTYQISNFVYDSSLRVYYSTIQGTSAGDVLEGTSGVDWIFGQSGHDHLSGYAGNDQLYGGEGNDTLLGGAGDDILDGGIGNDTIVTVAGNAAIKPDAGFDRVDGGSGTDLLILGGFQSDYQVLNAGGRSYLVTTRGATEVTGI